MSLRKLVMRMIKKQYANHLQFVLQVSKATLDSYLSDLDLFEKFIEKDVLKVTDQELLDYFHYLSKENSSSTLARKMSALRSFYQYCLMIDAIDYDPTHLLKVSNKDKLLPKYLTVSDVKQLCSFELNEPEDYLDRAIIEVLFSCGLRVSELINIVSNRYFKQEGFFKILGKGNKERIVPIHQKGIEILNNYELNARNKYNLKMSPYLFINSKSLPLTRQSVYNRLKKRQKQVGLSKDVSPHILRHSFASAMINNDADLRVVQELLGHSAISTTQIYTHLESRFKKKMYDQYHPGQHLKEDLEDNE